ncbi:hypothetical protein SAMN03097699_0292 [Flavobacteriaceae bacterium MAR_2010_188]|nr:hypothetical protein SAMN03097699_0292 [Flavobacteriaceae bacterium MAR_2010_188]
MKYTRLTKEQFEELQQEFINFLATQSITKDEWATIKRDKPEVAEEELDVFSDLVWEGVLSKVEYIEHISPKQLHLFYFDDAMMKLIALKINHVDVDLTTADGFDWLRNNLISDKIEIFNSNKDYSEDKGRDKFELIYKGGNITKGQLYKYFDNLIN